ncbi:MAG: hypothetical protein Q4B67_09660 [Eubacteriales bacterium]|nr:hypothetical protein [Eubacteriales bacterium]
MAFVNKFEVAPAEWLPIQDQEVIDRVGYMDISEHQGKVYENPDFDVQVVWELEDYFVTDLFQRIRMSDVNDKKLVMILPSPENAIFISCVEALNKYQVSCRNVHVFFLYEYANEKGEVAPWQSPYSRSGHFMRYFYNRLEEHLRMPIEQVHFFTKENASNYSDMIAAEGGADVIYTTISWSGGIGAIDAESYPAETMEEFLEMGSGIVKPCMENLAFDSLRGMFGCSGDVGNVPSYTATIGPRDIAAAKERVHVEYLSACGGSPSLQNYPLKMALFGPVSPKNPGSMMRLFPGTCFIDENVAKNVEYTPDQDWLQVELDKIREKEEA